MLYNTYSKFLNLLLPPLCLVCGTMVGAEMALCPDCWKKITFIAAPFCKRCGTPFSVPVEAATVCGECLANPPVFARARSAMIYNADSRSLLLSFKHGDGLHLTRPLAAWMRRAGQDILMDADVIIPVPLNRWRLFARRYNQSALLAVAIGREANVPVVVDGLLRTRRTQSQGHLNRTMRRENLAGAIAVAPARRRLIEGKRVVLVDDVMTSGATADECSRALLAAGALDVSMLTLARATGRDS